MNVAPELLEAARAKVASAQRILALTGAGVSAESGIPTFRGAGGLWRDYRPEDLATPEAFARDPKLVWEWYDWRRGLVAAARPNPGHRALAALAERHPSLSLVTQNVDGLHAIAGSPEVVELHGSLWRTRCTQCGVEREERRQPLPELPPRCACGGLERPAIVWFGERLPASAWTAAEAAAVECDLILVIGTSSIVWPAASLVPIALQSGAAGIEVNPDGTPLSERLLVLRGPAGEVLPELLR
jgi:NAD-dependent deacetylase